MKEEEVITIMKDLGVEDFVIWCQENNQELPFGTWGGWLITKAKNLENEVFRLQDMICEIKEILGVASNDSAEEDTSQE